MAEASSNRHISVFQRWQFFCVMPMADWLGLKVTPEQQSIWLQERAAGMWSFVFRRGSVVGVFCAVLYCVQYAVRVSLSHRSWSLGEVASMSLFFIVAGDVWGLYVWRMLSKRFGPVNGK
jgi:hypothetical protein